MQKYDFAFIVHPRSKQELISSFSLFRFIPNFLLYLFPPRIIGEVILEQKGKIASRGALVAILNTPAQFLKRDKKIKKKILAGISLAQKHGAKIVGLGSLSSPAVSGGLDIQEQAEISITNGNALTAAVVINDIKDFSQMLQKRDKKIDIAIIGATGSIGQAVSRAIAEYANSLTIIARKKDKLDDLASQIKAQRPDMTLISSSTTEDAKKSNIIIVATSHHEAVLHPNGIKKGTIIYDITQPSNLKKSDWIDRNDILVIQGGLVSFHGLRVDPIIGLKEEESFACLAETILLSITGKTSQDFSVGYVTSENIKKIEKLSKQFNVFALPKKWNNKLDSNEIKIFIQKYD